MADALTVRFITVLITSESLSNTPVRHRPATFVESQLRQLKQRMCFGLALELVGRPGFEPGMLSRRVYSAMVLTTHPSTQFNS